MLHQNSKGNEESALLRTALLRAISRLSITFSLGSLLLLFKIEKWKVSVFGVILVRIFPHLDWIRENADQNNFDYGHFFIFYGTYL